MRLLIDAGNTRLKWRLATRHETVADGVGILDADDPLSDFPVQDGRVMRVAVSAVAAEERRLQLVRYLEGRFGVPVVCHWAESERGGLVNAYADVGRMGADRWHAMYGAWLNHRTGFAVVDAGSAITVDYVDDQGRHLGGYILPGRGMMLRSLQSDAARIGFEPERCLDTAPGRSTAECVNHGLAWLCSALANRVEADCRRFGLAEVLVTGGDAEWLMGVGLVGIHAPDLVIEGLAAIDASELAL